MKINENLVVINSSEFYDDGTRKHFRSGIEQQIEELAKHFKKAYLYAPQTQTEFEGYVMRAVEVRPLCQGLHTTLGEFLRRRGDYRKSLENIIEHHKNDFFCIYFPDSFIGVIAAGLAKKHKLKFCLRITADLAQEFKMRGASKCRKLLSVFVNPMLNSRMSKLVENTLAFYSGMDIYKAKGEHYVITSASFDRGVMFKRSDTCKRKPYKILYVGRFDKKKGIEFLISAMSILNKKGYDVRLTIVGFGGEETELRRVVEHLKLGNVVEFKGFVPFGPKLFNEYKKADIFVFPSLEDIQGKSYLEAMAFGVPVIATNVGCISNYVTDKKTGLLINPESSEEIYNAIVRITEYPKLRKKLIVNGYEIAKKCTLKRQADFMISKIGRYFKYVIR